MAIFHLSAKIISRSKGQSAIASAAYRSGEKLYDERYNETQDYTKKRFIEHSEIQLPQNAPAEYSNRQKLWNAVEKAERAKNAQLAREIELALPREIPLDQQIRLVHDYVKENFVKAGMVADWSIHNPQPDKQNPDRPANPHAHIMLTMRSIKSNGKWAPKKSSHYALDENGNRIPLIDRKTGKQKLGRRNQKLWKRVITPTNNWNDPKNVEKWRSAWEKSCNRYLAPDRQIDHRSYERQGLDQIPTVHEGHYAQQLEKKHPGSSWKIARNNAIREQNRIMTLILQKWRKLQKAINELKQRIKNAQNLEEERIHAQLSRLKQFNQSFGASDEDSAGTEETSRSASTGESTSISTDTEALIRETEAQRSSEKAQQRHADDERATREAERSRQSAERERQAEAIKRAVERRNKKRQGRSR